jgi:hypothetical protein
MDFSFLSMTKPDVLPVGPTCTGRFTQTVLHLSQVKALVTSGAAVWHELSSTLRPSIEVRSSVFIGYVILLLVFGFEGDCPS